MGKQPYIPIYIGDWEQDTNCITLEAEGALIKLIFKLWKSPEKGLLTFCFSNLAIMLKISPEKTQKILQELSQNRILDIEYLQNEMVKISSRRMIREAYISKVRSESGLEGGRGRKKQTKSKTKAKQKQPLEIEYENEEWKLLFKKWYDFRLKIKKPIHDASIQAAYNKLLKLSEGNIGLASEIINESIAQGWTGLFKIKHKDGKHTIKQESLNLPEGTEPSYTSL